MQQLSHVRFPEEASLSSQGILNYIAAREEAGLEHHAIWVLRHGKVAAKLAYAPYDDHTPHMLFSLFAQGIHDAGPVRSSILSVTEPVSAALLAFFWLGTQFTIADLVGFAAILATVFLLAKQE